MSESISSDNERKVVETQVRDLLAQSAAYRALPAADREQIFSNTAAVVETLAQQGGASGSDPYAVAMGPAGAPGIPGAGLTPPGGSRPAPTFTGGATQRPEGVYQPKSAKDFGIGVATGVAQAGELLRQVNFPAFVSELIQGVFRAVVDASIDQMKAYGELVQSVVMSLNDFKEQNVSTNQARDHLASKYPSLMQVNIVEGQPRMGVRHGADTSELPNFKEDLGIDADIGDLDEESMEEVLVPAARNDLARRRQSLLATMVLMGINRIVVTDGRINAKLKFDFRTADQTVVHAQDFDYVKDLPPTIVDQIQTESSKETGASYKSSESRSGWSGKSRSEEGESSRWTKESRQRTEMPTIVVAGITDTTNQAELEASAKLSGEVSLNFKSETFDLNKLASADDMFKMESARSAGRGAQPPGSAATPPGGAAPAPGGGAAAPAGGGGTTGTGGAGASGQRAA